MGTSFVGIGEKGFWIRDSTLEVWLRLLALHVEDNLEPGSVAKAIRDRWLLQSRGYFNGFVSVGLEEAVNSPGGELVVRAAIKSLMTALAAAPTDIPREVLNLLGFESGNYKIDFETSNLTEVGLAFIALLDGEMASVAESTAFMPGRLQTRG